MKRKEFEFGISLHPKWVRRSDVNLQLADIGSKLISSSDEYGVGHFDFCLIQDSFRIKLSCDAMASDKSRRVEKFVSGIPQKFAYDVDIFTCTLKADENYYFHPPVNMIIRVLNKILLYPDLTAVVVVPCWVSKPFFVRLIDQGCFKPFVKSYLLWSPLYVSFSKQTMFSGRKQFLTLAVLIKTKESNAVELPKELMN